MPIEFMAHFIPETCQARPSALFCFGDNLLHRGKAGQAIIRDEPNAVGFPTKRAPSMEPGSFLTDEDFIRVVAENLPVIERLEDHLRAGKDVVWPKAGIGTGLANLKHNAPMIRVYYDAVFTTLQQIKPDVTSSIDNESEFVENPPSIDLPEMEEKVWGSGSGDGKH